MPPTRRELLIISVITAFGFLLRILWIGRAGLSQFDEGVYAFGALGLSSSAEPFGFLPGQERIAPPVFTFLASLMARLMPGQADFATILLNVVLGTLTIGAVWWIGRQWFGGPAAIAAATLVSFSEAQILASRSALSDTTFTLAFLISMHLLARAAESPSTQRAVLAGLAVATSLNTKYHGWFALVIAAPLVLWRVRRSREGVRSQVRMLLTVAVVTLAGFVPWLVFIWTRPASVQGFAQHYAGFLRLNWLENASRYVRLELYLDGAWSRASLVLALVTALIVLGPRRISLRWWLVAAALGIASLFLGSFIVLLLAAIVSLRWLFEAEVPLSWALASGWCLLWIVSAPIYQPYFRLLMPLLVAASLILGRLLADLVSTDAQSSPVQRLAIPVTGALAAIVLLVTLRAPRLANPWRDSRSMARVADSISTFVPAGTVMFVIGEPPLAFYLHQRGGFPVRQPRLPELLELSQPTILVSGIYSARSKPLRDFLGARQDRLQLQGTADFAPSDLRLLDDYGPWLARRWRAHPDSAYRLRVWRYTPVAGPVP